MARKFNPGEHESDGAGYVDTAGEYMLAGRLLKRDKSRKGKEFFLIRFEVLGGQHKGKSMQQRIYLNDESLWKLGNWCESMQQREAFDLDCNRESYLALCNRPFMAKVELSSGGDGKRYADIRSFYKRVTERQQKFIDGWRAEWESKVDSDGDKNLPRKGKAMGDNQESDEFSDVDEFDHANSDGGGFDDDDIPF